MIFISAVFINFILCFKLFCHLHLPLGDCTRISQKFRTKNITENSNKPLLSSPESVMDGEDLRWEGFVERCVLSLEWKIDVMDGENVTTEQVSVDGWNELIGSIVGLTYSVH